MGRISFVTKKVAIEGWLETKGDAYWTDNGNFDWDAGNERYYTSIAEGTQVSLDATSAFADWSGSHMKFTFTNSTDVLTVLIKDTDGNVIGTVEDTTLSGETIIEVPITWGSFDIGEVQFNTEGIDWISFYLTSIEAYQGDKPANWVEHWDDSDMDSYYGSWDGNKWPSTEDKSYPDEEIVELDVIGSWADTYRPTKIRVTFTGVSTLDMLAPSTNPSERIVDGNYSSGEEITLNWTDNEDFSYIVFVEDNNTPFAITKIEWLE